MKRIYIALILIILIAAAHFAVAQSSHGPSTGVGNPWVDTRGYSSITAAHAAAAARGYGILLSTNIAISTGTTVTVPVSVISGGRVTVATGVTATFSTVTAPCQQWIYGTGNVAFSTDAAIKEVCAEWKGAKGDYSNNDTAAVQWAINTGFPLRGLAAKTYLVSGITITRANAVIRGGTGTTKFAGGAANGSTVYKLIAASNASVFTIGGLARRTIFEDIEIDGTKSSQTSTVIDGISLIQETPGSDYEGSTICQRVFIHDCARSGFRSDLLRGANHIRDSMFYNNGVYGIELRSPDNTIYSSGTYSNGTAGVFDNNWHNSFFSVNSFWNGGSGFVIGIDSIYSHFTKIESDHNNNAGIYIIGSAGTISDAALFANNASGGSYSDIMFDPLSYGGFNVDTVRLYSDPTTSTFQTAYGVYSSSTRTGYTANTIKNITAVQYVPGGKIYPQYNIMCYDAATSGCVDYAASVKSFVSSANTGTTVVVEHATYTIPGNSVGENGLFKITTLWGMTNNANAKSGIITLGTTTVATFALASGAKAGPQIIISNANSRTQQVSRLVNYLGGATMADSAEDTTVNLVLSIKSQLANAADTITLYGYIIEPFQ